MGKDLVERMEENGEGIDVFCGFQLRFAKLKPAKLLFV